MKHTLITLILSLLAIAPCRAQWQQDSGIATYQVLAFGAVDTNLFVSLANTFYGNYLQRRDPWVPGGWPECDNHQLIQVTSIAFLGPYLYVADDGAVIRTIDLGKHWIGVSTDSTGQPITAGNALAVSGDTVYCSGDRSTDSGNLGTWQVLSTLHLDGMVAIGNHLIGGSAYSGVWHSTNAGQTWTKTGADAWGPFAIVDSAVFTGGGSIWRSTDLGAHWDSLQGQPGGGPNVSIATDGKNLFAGTYDGVYVSTNRGISWQAVNQGFPNGGTGNWVSSMAVFEDSILYVNISGSRGNPNMQDWSTWHRPISEMVDTTEGVVEQLPPGDTIEVYPNPARNYVSILAGGTSILGVRVMNVLGNVMGSGIREPETGNITLDFSKLPSGTYFIEVQTPKGTVLRKLVRE